LAVHGGKCPRCLWGIPFLISPEVATLHGNHLETWKMTATMPVYAMCDHLYLTFLSHTLHLHTITHTVTTYLFISFIKLEV